MPSRRRLFVALALPPLALAAWFASPGSNAAPATQPRLSSQAAVLAAPWPAVRPPATTTTTSSPPPTTVAPPPTPSRQRPAAVDYSSIEPCGGDLPPCWVKQRESRGNYGAVNPTGCGGRGCYGAWQFDPRTWDSEAAAMGRPDLVGVYLPAPADQDAVARFTWNGGAGCGHWGACGG